MVLMSSLSFLNQVGSLTRYDFQFISYQASMLSCGTGEIVDEAREEVVRKEASTLDKSVECGISSGQRKEPCETLI